MYIKFDTSLEFILIAKNLHYLALQVFAYRSILLSPVFSYMPGHKLYVSFNMYSKTKFLEKFYQSYVYVRTSLRHSTSFNTSCNDIHVYVPIYSFIWTKTKNFYLTATYILKNFNGSHNIKFNNYLFIRQR